jgi:hypothetical protein
MSKTDRYIMSFHYDDKIVTTEPGRNFSLQQCKEEVEEEFTDDKQLNAIIIQRVKK